MYLYNLKEIEVESCIFDIITKHTIYHIHPEWDTIGFQKMRGYRVYGGKMLKLRKRFLFYNSKHMSLMYGTSHRKPKKKFYLKKKIH